MNKFIVACDKIIEDINNGYIPEEKAYQMFTEARDRYILDTNDYYEEGVSDSSYLTTPAYIYALENKEATQDDIQIFLEAYFGKNKTLLEIESLLGKCIEYMKKEGHFGKDLTKSKENKAIEAKFKQLFGFKEVYITWIDRNIPNAFTFVGSHVLSPIKKSITFNTNVGYYDSKHMDTAIIFLYTSVLNKLNLSTAEVLSIILHEFGHNFDYNPYNISKFIIQLIFTLGMSDIQTRPEMKKYYAKYYRALYRKETPDDIDLANTYNDILMKYNRWSKIFMAPLNAAASTISTAVLSPYLLMRRVITGSLTNGSEMFADSFAASYGYGPQLISALEKMNKSMDKGVSELSPITKHLYDLGSMFDELNGLLLEVHGSNQQRAMLLIKKLERDCNNPDYPPKVQEELKKEINEVKILYSNILEAKLDDDENLKLVSKFRKMVDNVFGGTLAISKRYADKYQV